MRLRFVIAGVVGFVLAASCSGQTVVSDSLHRVLAGWEGHARMIQYIALTETYIDPNPRLAIALGLEGMAYARELKDKQSEVELMASVAIAHVTINDFISALRYGEEARQIAKVSGDELCFSNAMNVMGIVCGYMGLYSRALDYHLQALEIRERLGHGDKTARSLNNIGVVYQRLGKFELAAAYYERSRTLRLGMGDTVRSSGTPINLGIVYVALHRYEEAEERLNEGYHRSKQSGLVGMIAYARYGFGLLYEARGRYREAVAVLEEALRLYTERASLYGTIEANVALGRILEKLGNREKAIMHLRTAVELGRKTNALDQLAISYETLYHLYEKERNASKAMEYFHLYSAMRDSLFGQSESNKIAELNVMLEQERKQREIESLRKEKTVSAARLDQQRANINLLITLVSASVVVIIMLFFYGSRIHKSKRLAEEQNARLGVLNDDLEEKISQIRVLKGLLPMCAHCKKIRNDTGYWEQLEGYISKHSDATFSHGICPDCAKTFFPNAVKKHPELLKDSPNPPPNA